MQWRRSFLIGWEERGNPDSCGVIQAESGRSIKKLCVWAGWCVCGWVCVCAGGGVWMCLFEKQRGRERLRGAISKIYGAALLEMHASCN